MSLSAELALAAARVRLLSESLPESARPDVAGEWRQLLDEVENTRSDGAKLLVILAWRERVEGRLSAKLAHAPLVEVSTPRRLTTRGQGRRGVLTPAGNERGAP